MLRSPVFGLVVLLAMAWSLSWAADTPSNQVLQALGRPDLVGDGSLSLQVKPWKPLGGSLVALIYVNAGEVVRTKRLQPTLAVLKEAGGKLTLLAKVEIDEARCRALPEGATEIEENDGGSDCEDMRVDLAPYRISPTETALGLRTKIHDVFGAGESETEYLTLFQVTGNTLRPIFSHEMETSDEQRGPGDMITAGSTLSVSDQQTSGYFDLLLSETVRVEKLGDNRVKPEQRQSQHRFVWQDNSYGEVK